MSLAGGDLALQTRRQELLVCPGLSAGPLGQPGNRISQRGRLEGTGQKRQLRADVAAHCRRALGRHDATSPSSTSTADLPDAAAAWQRGVDDLAANDDEVAEYVQALEQAQDTTDLPEASGDAIAREFEKYLRRRDEDQ